MKKRLITLGAISAGILLSTPAYALELFPGEQVTDFRVYIGNLYLFLIAAGITIATVLIMIGGVIWITSAGDGGRIQTAKSFIIDSIMGVVILLSSYFILQVINPDLVNLKPLTPPSIQFETGACYYTKAGEAVESCLPGATEGTCSQLPKSRFAKNTPCDAVSTQKRQDEIDQEKIRFLENLGEGGADLCLGDNGQQLSTQDSRVCSDQAVSSATSDADCSSRCSAIDNSCTGNLVSGTCTCRLNTSRTSPVCQPGTEITSFRNPQEALESCTQYCANPTEGFQDLSACQVQIFRKMCVAGNLVGFKCICNTIR